MNLNYKDLSAYILQFFVINSQLENDTMVKEPIKAANDQPVSGEEECVPRFYIDCFVQKFFFMFVDFLGLAKFVNIIMTIVICYLPIALYLFYRMVKRFCEKRRCKSKSGIFVNNKVFVDSKNRRSKIATKSESSSSESESTQIEQKTSSKSKAVESHKTLRRPQAERVQQSSISVPENQVEKTMVAETDFFNNLTSNIFSRWDNHLNKTSVKSNPSVHTSSDDQSRSSQLLHQMSSSLHSQIPPGNQLQLVNQLPYSASPLLYHYQTPILQSPSHSQVQVNQSPSISNQSHLNSSSYQVPPPMPSYERKERAKIQEPSILTKKTNFKLWMTRFENYVRTVDMKGNKKGVLISYLDNDILGL